MPTPKCNNPEKSSLRFDQIIHLNIRGISQASEIFLYFHAPRKYTQALKVPLFRDTEKAEKLYLPMSVQQVCFAQIVVDTAPP